MLFPHVFEPLAVGRVRLRNRIFVSAHTTNFAENHCVSRRHVDYHRRRAAGGVGLIVTEGLRVHPTTLKRPETLSVWTDQCIDGLGRLAEAVHAEGAQLFGQLLHSGREAADDYARTPAWGASPIPWTRGGYVPHPIGADEIVELVDCFAAGARRVVAAGLDGLEIHLGYGHLLQQFLSPVSNHRQDGYGGTAAQRRRLVDEVLARVRMEVPSDLAFGVRVSADEFVAGGLTLATMVPLVSAWVGDYDLNFVDVSHSAYVGGPSLATQIADMAYGPAPFRQFPRAFRRALPGIPILAACRIDGLEVAEDVLSSGDADAVAMTRAHIADPDIIGKHRRGLKPRRCTACNQLCIGRTATGLPMSCVVNPEVGLEGVWENALRRYDTVVAGRPRILVVGGGPAGMEAALTAARWADVTLIERRDRLGGKLATAARMHGRSNWQRLIVDQEADCRRTGVNIRLGRSFVPGQFESVRYEGIVIATGGVTEPRTLNGAGKMTLVGDAASLAPGATPRTCIVFDDVGGWTAWGFVEHLAYHGVVVHYVSPLSTLAPGITVYSRLGLLDRLRATGCVQVHLMTDLVRRSGNDVLVNSDLRCGDWLITDVDTVYDVGTSIPRLPHAVDHHVTVVGDSYAPRDAGWAVFSGRIGALRTLADIAMASDDPNRRLMHRELDALPLLGLIANGHSDYRSRS